jgi:hypothetical protein
MFYVFVNDKVKYRATTRAAAASVAGGYARHLPEAVAIEWHGNDELVAINEDREPVARIRIEEIEQ